MTTPAPSPARRGFEQLARAGDWPNARLAFNGLSMTEMLLSYEALDAPGQTNLKQDVKNSRMLYAFSIVDDSQMPAGDSPPLDLRATGQEEEAREYLAKVPSGLTGYFFDDLLTRYPQGTPEAAKSFVGGNIDDTWVTNTCAVRISRVLNYSGMPIPHGKTGLAVASGADKNWYAFRQKELRAWFVGKVGAPSLTLPSAAKQPRPLWNLKGFIGFDIHFADATGHFDLWDGEKFQLQAQATHDYFAIASKVVFWRVPSWKKP